MAEQYTVSIDLEIIDEAEMELIIEKYTGADGKSAYQYAVEKGYTGTETEFATYMANAAWYSEHIQVVVDDAIQEALESGEFVPNFSIGTVSTLPAGSQATITITGTGAAPVLNFGIPQGIQGIQGDPGPKGDTGSVPVFTIGTVTDVPYGTPSSATITGTPEAPVLNLYLQHGASGNETIDDTAGIGDTDLVWSADKIKKELNTKADIIGIVDDTAEAVKTIPDGADGIPMALKVGIEPVQSGSGDPSPTNVRPISGWTGCNVTRTGKNLFDISTCVDGYIADDGSVGTDGYNKHSALIPVKQGEYYTYSLISNNTSAVNRRIHGYDKNGNWVQMIDKNSTSGVGTKTCTVQIPSGIAFVKIQFYTNTNANRNDTNIQFEFGTSATEYELFGDTYSITFPSSAGTVYGGTLTVNKDGTGTLVSQYAYSTLGAVSEIKDSSGGTGKYVEWTLSDMLVDDSVRIALAEKVKTVARSEATRSAWEGNSYTSKSIPRFGVFVPSDYTIQQINDALEGSHVIYRLAEPTTYQLSALEVIETLKGINNIFADTGDILSVGYSADTKMYVDAGDENKQEQIDLTRGMIAESDNTVATENHAVGDLFVCGNNLYKAIDTISVGETLAVGENVELTTIVDNLISQSIAEYYYSWVIGSARGSGSYYVFKSGRLRTLSASLNPVCFTSDFLDAEDRPTQDTTNFLANYAYYSNNQRISELCLLRYTKASNVWELVKGDGTALALGDDVADKASTQSITFNAIWYV